MGLTKQVGQFHPISHTAFSEQVVVMIFDSSHRNEQFISNLLVGLARLDQPDNFFLPAGNTQ